MKKGKAFHAEIFRSAFLRTAAMQAKRGVQQIYKAMHPFVHETSFEKSLLQIWISSSFKCPRMSKDF